MADCRAIRLFSDLNNAFKKDPQIDEFDVLSVVEPRHNRSPIILQEHKLGIEAWAGKILLKYSAHRLTGWRQRLPEEKFIDASEIVQLSRAVLLFNPDNYTAWNIRKELIENGNLTVGDDLMFGALVLSKHPKSPETFIHRRWLFQQLLDYCLSSSSGSNTSCSGAGAASLSADDSLLNVNAINVDIGCSADAGIPFFGAFSLEASRLLISHTQMELRVSEKAAERYPCNYHAWSHRIWIMQHCLNSTLQVLQSELKAMSEWTRKHISDHSGFHYRQFLIHEMLVKKGKQSITNCQRKDLLQEEMAFICDLIRSFPGHEAMWYHRRFVMSEILNLAQGSFDSKNSLMKDTEGNVCSQEARAKEIMQEIDLVANQLGCNPPKYEKQLQKNYLSWLERLK